MCSAPRLPWQTSNHEASCTHHEVPVPGQARTPVLPCTRPRSPRPLPRPRRAAPSRVPWKYRHTNARERATGKQVSDVLFYGKMCFPTDTPFPPGTSVLATGCPPRSQVVVSKAKKVVPKACCGTYAAWTFQRSQRAGPTSSGLHQPARDPAIVYDNRIRSLRAS